MNGIVNKIFVAGDRLCLKCIRNKVLHRLCLVNPVNMDLRIVLVDHLLKTKGEYKNLKKEQIQDIFIKATQTKPTFNMTWLTEILKAYLEEQLPIKYYGMSLLILLKLKKYDRYQRGLASVFYNFLIKKNQVMQLLKVKRY